MEQFIKLVAHKNDEREIKNLLTKQNIEYTDVVMLSSNIEIIKLGLYNIPWTEIAAVLALYIKGKQSRKIEIIDKDGLSLKTTGFSKKESMDIYREHKQLDVVLLDNDKYVK